MSKGLALTLTEEREEERTQIKILGAMESSESWMEGEHSCQLIVA